MIRKTLLNAEILTFHAKVIVEHLKKNETVPSIDGLAG